MAFARHTGGQIYDEAGRRKYLSEAEHARFLKAADDLPPIRQALCQLIAYAGCRPSEACAIGPEHLDPDRCTVTIRTLKRRRRIFRIVPLPESLVRLLLSLPVRDGRFSGWPDHRVTAWRWIKTVMAAVGIAGPMATCKGLRHGFAMRAVANGVPSNMVQQWLGHASVHTTAIYMNAVGQEERALAARTWPAALQAPLAPLDNGTIPQLENIVREVVTALLPALRAGRFSTHLREA